MKIVGMVRVFDNDKREWRAPEPITSGVNQFQAVVDAHEWLRTANPSRDDIHPNDLVNGQAVRVRYEIGIEKQDGYYEIDSRTFECRMSFMAREMK